MLLHCLISICQCDVCGKFDETPTCGNFSSLIHTKVPMKIEIISGVWTESDSGALAQYGVLSSFTFGNNVRFNGRLDGNFGGFWCEKFQILSPDCVIAPGCFSKSRIKDFTALYIDRIPQGCFLSSGLVTINATSVSYVEESGFCYCYDLVNVSLGTVNETEAYAFYFCRELTMLDIMFSKNAVIGDDSFGNCAKLTEQYIDFTNIEKVGARCFRSCKSLRSVNITGDMIISQEAFAYCNSIQYLEAHDVTYIEERAFVYCLKIENISMFSIEVLSKECFTSCTSLSNIYLPNVVNGSESCFNDCHALETINLGFKHIGNMALAYCCSLTTVIMNDLISIGERCFDDSENLQSVSLNSLTDCSSSLFMGKSISTFSATSLTVIPEYCFSECSGETKFDIPACKTICDYAFQGIKFAMELCLPHLMWIGNYAFKDSLDINLTEIGVLDYIGHSAFQGVSSLAIVYRSSDELRVRSFGSNCFLDCGLMPFIDCSVIETLNGTFSYWEAASRMTMPELKSVEGCPFANFWNLSTLILNSVVACDGGIARNCSILSTVEMNNLTTISDTFLIDCPGVTALKFKSLGICGSSAFEGMLSLTSIDINACYTISDRAFYGCKNLVSVNGAKLVDLSHVTTIGESAFENCQNIEHVILAGLDLNRCTFRGCTSLMTVKSNEVTNVGESVFEGCTSLGSISLPQVVTIGDSCFRGCSSLESADLRVCDEIIGDCNFMDCNSLKWIDFRELDKVNSSAINTFARCRSLEILYLGEKTFKQAEFANQVFVLTERGNKPGTNVLNIDICLKEEDDYEKLREDLSSKVWKGISLYPPDDYEHRCAAIFDQNAKNNDNTVWIALVSTISCLVVVGVIAGFIIYKKVIIPVKEQHELDLSLSEQLNLTRAIIDDFG